jgi:hypothetical protein
MKLAKSTKRRNSPKLPKNKWPMRTIGGEPYSTNKKLARTAILDTESVSGLEIRFWELSIHYLSGKEML